MKKYLLLLSFIFLCGWAFAVPIDSLRSENIDGQLFVIHKVDPKETLFGLSRRYNVEVDEIKKYNPSLLKGLKMGDILKIPVLPATQSNEAVHVVQPGETLFSISKEYNVSLNDLRDYNRLKSNEISIGQELYLPEAKATNSSGTRMDNPEKYLWHVVQKGETLYGLSVVYGTELEQLKKWNQLLDNVISIGDSIIVGEKKQNQINSYTSVTLKPDIQKEEEVAHKENNVEEGYEEKPVKKETSNQEKNKDTVYASRKNDDVEVTKEVVVNAANFEEIVETGLAELIQDSGNSKKYLALHRTAKIGTIIRVHNEMNGQEVFVRVIGQLPDTGVNDKVLIKISKAAYDRLAAIDKKFRVRISYFPD